MSLFEFEKGDIIRNTIVSYPKNKFLFYKGDVIYNDSVQELDSNWDGGADETLSKYIPSGHISLYELNIDRQSGTDDSNLIRPFVKGGSEWMPTTSVDPSELPEPDADGNIYGYYPLSSSIDVSIGYSTTQSTVNTKIESLRNTIDYYKYMSKEFNSDNVFGPFPLSDDDTPVAKKYALISIPSIFYGKKIKPGTVRIEIIVEGSQSENIVVSDVRKNGELLRVDEQGEPISYQDSNGEEKFSHGIVLYNEGFAVIYSEQKAADIPGVFDAWPSGVGNPWGRNENEFRWIDIGVPTSSLPVPKIAWSIEFEGVTETPVMTMFAHARKNELNHSNNPSFLKLRIPVTSSNSHVYREEDSKEIRNVTKTDLLEEDPIFEKETYISKIAIYDDQKKVIGYARLARPIRKTEEREMTFKLKIDL